MTYKISKKKRHYQLTVATLLALGLASGTYGHVAMASDSTIYTHAITADEAENVKNFEGAKVSTDESGMVVDFSNVTNPTIQTDGSAIAIGLNSSATIIANTLNIFSKGNTGFDISDGNNVVVDGNLNIHVVGDKAWTGKGLGMSRNGTGEGSEAHLTIKGSVTMKGLSKENPWGVSTSAKDIHGGYNDIGYRGSRWAPDGISLGMAGGSTITVEGPVDLAVKGIAVKTDPFYPSATLSGPELATINLNGGGSIVVPDDTTEGWYSLASFGGTINANVNSKKTAPGYSSLHMVGNVIAIKGRILNGVYSGNPFFYQDGEVNIGLGTSDSYWKGIVDNAGAHYSGDVNVFINKGGTWDYTAVGKKDGLQGLFMPAPSRGHYGKYKPFSFVNKLVGGPTEAKAGNIVMSDTAPIRVNSYAGHMHVFYGHTGDGTKTADYTAGNIEIKEAKPGSVITLLTDGTSVNTTDVAATTTVLNALAGKLLYNDYKDNANNLKGFAGISSGLTSSAVIQEVSPIIFNGTAQGSVTEAPSAPAPEEPEAPPGPELFEKRIISDNYVLKDQWKYWVDLEHNKNQYNYTFSQPTTIQITGRVEDSTQDGGPGSTVNNPGRFNGRLGWGAIMWAGYHPGTISMNQAPLHLDVKQGKAKDDTVTGIIINSETLTMQDMGSLAIDIHTETAAAAGIQVAGNNSLGILRNGDGKSKLIIANDDSPEHAVNIRLEAGAKAQDLHDKYNGIYAWKNSGTADVDIHGLVNIDMPFGNAIWANGGHVAVGGGSFNVADKDGLALRATNGGTVFVNTSSQDGKFAMANENRPVAIKGGIDAQAALFGQHNVIAIGLNGENSRIDGLIRSDVNKTNMESEGVHLFLNNKAVWNNGGDVPHLWTKEGSSVVSDPDIKDSAAADVSFKGSAVKRLESHGGIIEQHNMLPITIASFGGDAVVKYISQEGRNANVVGGALHILNADPNSTITMVTEQKTKQPGFLLNRLSNALASKLVYEGWANGEYNLSGKVLIASDLTNSAVMQQGYIVFDDATGIGSFNPKERPKQKDREFTTIINGEKNPASEYVKQGIFFKDGAYLFREDSTVAMTDSPVVKLKKKALVNGAGKVLTLTTTSTGDAVTVETNAVKLGKKSIGVPVTLQASQLNINAHSQEGEAIGILAKDEMQPIRSATGTSAPVLAAGVTLHGPVAITATGKTKSVGILVKNGSTVASDGALTIDMSGNTSETYAVDVQNGEAKLSGDKEVAPLTIKGNIRATDEGFLKAQLSGTNASWTGIGMSSMHKLEGIVNHDDEDENKTPDHEIEDVEGWEDPDESAVTLTQGIDLTINKGATWVYNNVGADITNPDAIGITMLQGGASSAEAGRVKMEYGHDLHVGNYQGNLQFLYEHDNKGTQASDYKAGNIHIENVMPAKVAPSATLVTDAKNIDMSNRDEVNTVLNTLANKLFNHEEKNPLRAKVQIASDLTRSSVVNTFGLITFDKQSGQGSYVVSKGDATLPAILSIEGNDENYAKNLDVFTPEHNYEFTQNTTINTTEKIKNLEGPLSGYVSGALLFNQSHLTGGTHYIDMAGFNLTLNAKDETKGARFDSTTGASALAVNSIDKAIVRNVDTLRLNATIENAQKRVAYGVYARDTDVVFDNVKNTDIQIHAMQRDAGAGVYVQTFKKDTTFQNDNPMNIDVHGQSPVFAFVNNSTEHAKKASIIVGGGTFKTEGNVFANLPGNSHLTINKTGKQKVQMVGNIISKEYVNGYKNKNMEKNSVHITLSTNDSFWKGAAGLGENNVFSLTLENGAVWEPDSIPEPKAPEIPAAEGGVTWNRGTGVSGTVNSTQPSGNTGKAKTRSKRSLADAPAADFKVDKKGKQPVGPAKPTGKPVVQGPEPGIDTSAFTEVTKQHIDTLVGGTNADNRGFIVRKDPTQLNVNVAKGFLGFAYEHKGDGTKETDFTGGSTIIASADPGTDILLITNQDGIDTNDKAAVHAAYENLANKITYSFKVLNEDNIKARVGLASGLTASAAQASLVKDEMIHFDALSGTGTLKAPETASESSPVITGLANKDEVYKKEGMLVGTGSYKTNGPLTITTEKERVAVSAPQALHIDAGDNTISINNFTASKEATSGIRTDGPSVDIKARAISVRTMNRDGRAEGIGVSNNSLATPTNTTITGDLTVNILGKGYALGLYNSGNANTVINGNLTIKGSQANPSGITNLKPDTADVYFSTSGIYAGSNYNLQRGPNVVVNGDVDVSVVNGTGFIANGGGSHISINGGGRIVASSDNKSMDAYAVTAMSGSVSLNMNETRTASLGKKLVIDGNIGLLKDAINDNEPEKKTAVSLGLSTQDSEFHGAFISDISDKKEKEGWTKGVEMTLENGALWNNEVRTPTKQENYGVPITHFRGGETPERAGVILQNSEAPITIDNYEGHTVVSYEGTPNTKRGESPVIFKGGEISINHAKEKSSIILNTTDKGIDLNNNAVVHTVLNELAHKLVYGAADEENGLTGRVQIASGLTSSIKAIQVANISFNNHKGFLTDETTASAPETDVIVRDPSHIYETVVLPTPYESALMLGARKAMTSAALQWRQVDDEVIAHMQHGENAEKEGPWVALTGGSYQFNDGTGVFSSDATGFTMGVDHVANDSLRTGAAVTRRQTTDTYDDIYMDAPITGFGKNAGTAVSVYAMKTMPNGQQWYASGTVGQISNPYNVSNEHSLTTIDGTYRATGSSVYLGYSRGDSKALGIFAVPRIGLHWSRLSASNYKATTKDNRTLSIRQSAYQSLVAGAGVSVGRRTQQGSIYANLDLYRELKGDITGSYYDGVSALKTTTYHGQQTWIALGLGADYALNPVTDFTVRFDKTWGGDFTKKWGMKAQLRYHF